MITVTVAAIMMLQAIQRMDGTMLDYTSTDGFRLLHNDQGRTLPLLTIPALN